MENCFRNERHEKQNGTHPPHCKPVRASRQRTEVKCGDGRIMGWSGHKELKWG